MPFLAAVLALAGLVALLWREAQPARSELIAASPSTAVPVPRPGPAEVQPPVLDQAPRTVEGLDAPPARRATRPEPDAAAAASAWLEHLDPRRFAGLTPEQARSLTELDLRDTEVTDEDLRHLRAFPSLASLSLRGTPITDAGVAHLRGLELASLELRGTQVTGSGLWQLPWTLAALDLSNTRVTSAHLYGLPSLPDLRTLDLNFLDCDDSVADALARFPSLRHVELDRSGLTDDGLRRLLGQNPLLTRVELRNTQVSLAAVEQLKSLYPDCELVLDRSLPGLLGPGDVSED